MCSSDLSSHPYAAAAPGLSPTGSYYFTISPVGLVTKNSSYDVPVASVIGNMSQVFNGYIDDGSQQIEPSFNVTFLGTSYAHFFLDSNAGAAFGGSTANIVSPTDPYGLSSHPGIVIGSNDACITEIYTETVGSSPNRTFTVKYRGNTRWNEPNHPVNYEIDIRFFENSPGYVDVIVSQEPTDWASYTGGQGNVAWGITDGSNWVDGLPNHDSSFGA